MGDVIRNSAAREDIFKDGRTALTNARARGSNIQERAEIGLGPAITLVEVTEQEFAAGSAELATLKAARDAENDRADAILDRTYDDTWNDIGRPANDRFLALMYPGGAGYYTDGDVAGQPTRMKLLAKLYEKSIHPKLTPAQSQAYAQRILQAAADLKADIDAMAEPAANVMLLDRTLTAMARVVQFELANLKRMYKIDGLSEAEIHTIIPDRPVAKKT